jgi:hypothetical protein
MVAGDRHVPRRGNPASLLGADHLPFVLGLLPIVKDRWMLVKTITAFTVAHSITLAIATFGYAACAGAAAQRRDRLSISLSRTGDRAVLAGARRASRSDIRGWWRSPSGCSTASAWPAR